MRGGGGELTGKEKRRIFWSDRNVPYFDENVTYTVYTFVKNLIIVQLRSVYFTVCKLYLNKIS